MNSLSNLESIFEAALDKRSSQDRAAYLDEACRHDPEMRRHIDKLLQAQARAGSFLQNPNPGPAGTIDQEPREQPGTIIGPYKLLQQIGEGGMGVVYMAEQLEPVRRKVALKIIKPGMDSRQVIARFEAERQALAMMDHQNIARVLDAGTVPVDSGQWTVGSEKKTFGKTQEEAAGGQKHAPSDLPTAHCPLPTTGRPYFVMELVHGVPITQFCDDNKLTPRERLALFVPVCQAIQHAHQKGIIHRDVKPSNVLVTMYDDKPVPKVIDFGVAKAIEQRLTEKSLFTQFGALVGTFEYMSPEQAEMNAFGVDTRSDIYSLGVLLYELLTGSTPLEKGRLREAALNDLVRLIKEEEAPRPSVRLSSSGTLAKIAAARKTEPAKLSKLVRGEIDWIVMKCLEKDRSRRYETASGLARDVERYLSDEPVEACPPTASYRLRKFARKYKKALATAAAFAVLLIAGVVTSTLLAVWATSAEHDANRHRIASDDAKQKALDAKVAADKQRDEALVRDYAFGMGLAQHAWEENNVVRARELLEEVPKQVAGRNLRGFEWFYLSRLCQPGELTLTHPDRALCVAFSPDGLRVASGDQKTVRIWDSTTGKELFPLNNAGGSTGMAFSPDGKRLAQGSFDKTVKIWDLATGKELSALEGHAGGHLGGVRSVAFSPDGKRLASEADDNTLKIWDLATGKELVSIEGPAGFRRVAFSPDGKRLASGSDDKTVKIWDSATGKVLFDLKGHTGWVWGVAFSPDGQRLASGSFDKTVKIWDSATGKELFPLKGHDGMVTIVAFSPDGQRLASGSSDNTVMIWDLATGKEPFPLKGHASIIWNVAFSPDGQRLASVSEDKTVKIWDLATGKELFPLKGHAAWVTGVAFGPDGKRLASASEDKTVKIWDSATGKELFNLKGHAEPVSSVAFSPDGQRLASGSSDNTVKIWDLATGKELFDLKGHASVVWSVAFSPDGQRLASGSADQTVRIWDSVTGRELFALKGHAGSVQSVAFSPDGQRLASANFDGTINLWETKSVAPELQRLRAAIQVVADLFRQMPLRAEVLERLRTLPGLSESVRQEAIAAALTYPEEPSELNKLAWELVKLPGGEMSGYRKAVRYSEEACQLEPKDGLLLKTLGVAYYRVANYEKALATLLRSDAINKTEFKGSIPADLAFLAMTHHHLGHAKEAQAEFQRMRERMKDPEWAQNPEAQGFLREAEELLANPKTPGSK